MFYNCPLLTTFHHIISSFARLSRGILHVFKNSGERKAKSSYDSFTATGCGLFFRQQQLLVVAFFVALQEGVYDLPAPFGGDSLVSPDGIDSIVAVPVCAEIAAP
jgi:hypothetical protein